MYKHIAFFYLIPAFTIFNNPLHTSRSNFIGIFKAEVTHEGEMVRGVAERGDSALTNLLSCGEIQDSFNSEIILGVENVVYGVTDLSFLPDLPGSIGRFNW
jgi:hypothetical protein